jgi:hypothetical protein
MEKCFPVLHSFWAIIEAKATEEVVIFVAKLGHFKFYDIFAQNSESFYLWHPRKWHFMFKLKLNDYEKVYDSLKYPKV